MVFIKQRSLDKGVRKYFLLGGEIVRYIDENPQKKSHGIFLSFSLMGSILLTAASGAPWP
jgi:hypothetical protein